MSWTACPRLMDSFRSITCSLYVKIILSDYLRTILNLNRNPVSSDWTLDPLKEFKGIFDPQGVPRGVGNQVSVEFNMIYRWHSAISDRDAAWLGEFIGKMRREHQSDGTNGSECRPQYDPLSSLYDRLPSMPEEMTFNELHRMEDGGYRDKDLVDLIRTGTESIAGRCSQVLPLPRLIVRCRCLWRSKCPGHHEGDRNQGYRARTEMGSGNFE